MRSFIEHFKPFIKTIAVGNTMIVIMGATETEAQKLLEAEIERGLKKGETVRLSDGTKKWMMDEVVINTKKSGSAMYKWDRSGNKVLFERVLYTLSKGSSISTRELIKKIYKHYDQI